MSDYFRKPIVKTLMLKGQEGQSIKGITKTGTDGLVDTYTITLTDGTTSTFTVTNGKEISSISKTETSGLVDTYTIEFNDGTNSTFTVTNGKGISNISKTETSGLVDTYTIEFNDGTTSTFTVTNGDSAYKPAVEALGKRIDNLILSSGTESSAEVVDARNGYDGTTYDTLGTAIRKQVSELKGDLVKLSNLKWNDGKALRNVNDTIDIAGFSTSDYIPILEGITVTGENLYCESGQFASMVFVDYKFNVLSYSNEASAIAPKDSAYVRFGKLKATTNASVSFDKYLSSEILSKYFEEVSKRDEQHLFGQIVEWESGKFINKYGGFSSLSTFSVSQYLPCAVGSEFTAKGLAFDGGETYFAIAYYDKNKTYIPNSGINTESESEKYTVPNGAKYVVFCKINTSNYCIYSDYSLIDYLNSYIKELETRLDGIFSKINKKDIIKADNLSSEMKITTPHAKWGYEIDFHARVSTMGELTIGKSIGEYGSAYVRITDTMMYICMYTNDQEYILNNNRQGSAHNLNISDEITVRIVVTPSLFTVTLKSLGDSFTDNANVQGQGFADSVKAISNGGSYSNCELSYYCKDINNDVWVCADSYASYWSKKAYDLGYTNAFINALPGQNSVGALVTLQRALGKGTPKHLLWALGMNDGDDGAINTNWIETLNTVISICETNNIELILCTIPNTPTIDNSYKNNWIKSSDYRYIDVCECVGADLSTSWYDGLLSSDNVHPSDNGANVITDYICSSVPEMR